MVENIVQKKRVADCFRLLASCFYPPEKNLLLQENLCGNLESLLNGISAEAMKAAQRMGRGLSEGDEETLKVEYAALFVGPFEVLAPPYGSVYLEKGHRLMGDTTVEVARLYRESGLDLVVQQPADHIAFELEFMHYLASREISCLEEGDRDAADQYADRQQDFFGRFLCTWVSPFCRDIRKNTDNAFYLALADCFASFIKSNESCLSTVGCVEHVKEAVA